MILTPLFFHLTKCELRDTEGPCPQSARNTVVVMTEWAVKTEKERVEESFIDGMTFKMNCKEWALLYFKQKNNRIINLEGTLTHLLTQ
jgi:hypothetical protein